ncbi:hypothetical protein [uncultured Empedobacter sp.]|uniref:VOC family protein n=1 Tax=uncultured Empedobacter sp. TaxID=410844 RepID=UPI0025D472B9|nr:hypothetical protein [uncultured Empedobacter sp.]
MDENKSKIGQMVWADLTVENSTELKDFYKEVVGWEVKNVAMKDDEEEYNDVFFRKCGWWSLYETWHE